jgi:UDP-N-acetylmuramoylalanine--D-glutamate ligase
MFTLPFPVTARICILGYGVNHQELVGFLLGEGCAVTVRDRDGLKREVLFAKYPEAGAQLQFEEREDVTSDLEGFEVVFRSPGIPLASEGLQEALKRGVTVTSQTQLFLDLCVAKTIGVTGTKGKGTTSTLIFNILKAGFPEKHVYLAGNIGVDPFTFLSKLTSEDVVILELSSFQLDGLTKSPHIAVLLHVAQDHLDHHASLPAYREAKATIVKHQGEGDVAIINAEYPDMQEFLAAEPARVLRYHRHQPGQDTAWVDEQQGSEVAFFAVDGLVDSLSLAGRKLLGKHNLENILPAILVASLFHVSPNVMQREIVSFGGLEHRLSVVENERGILAIDDSIATTPESTLVALEAFEGKRIHLVAGGKDKGQDYMSLAPVVAQKCVSLLVLPGAASATLASLVLAEVARGSATTVVQAVSTDAHGVMEELIASLGAELKEGDVLLLAPSAASDTPYANYKERGEAFVQAVSGKVHHA